MSTEKLEGILKNADAARAFSRASGRFGVVFWLASIVVNETAPDALDDFVDEGPELWQKVLALRDVEYYDSREGFIEMLIDKERLGFLACVETPVLTYVSKDGDARGYSWGFYHQQWIYAETVDQLQEKALEVIKEMADHDIEKLRKEDAETLREESK